MSINSQSQEQPRTILVVEDDNELRDLLHTELKHEDYYIFTAHNGAVAVGKVRDQKHDIILSEEFICRMCRHIGPLELNKKGKLSIETILWVLFLIPGLVYSIWRRTGRWFACPDGGSYHLVPLRSPMGRDALAKKEQSTAELTGTKV